MFSIKSSHSDRELVFSDRKGDYFKVAIQGTNLNVHASVYAYTDAEGLDKLFQYLGHLERPWSGEKKWESLEGEFGLAVTCDTAGHVQFKITLRTQPGSGEETSISAGLPSEFGSLTSLARDSHRFFATP